jgi:hypothetical protein
MNNIVEPTMNHDFSTLYLTPPSQSSGGTYFTRILYENNKPLYIQAPKSLTKQGFIKNGKKMYTDLMFDNTNTVFIQWMENLETTCHQLIYDNGQLWFENKLEKDEIENAFNSMIKIYKSGKYYLVRVNVKPTIKIYDENEKVFSTEDITPDKTIISILEILGIKFTSRNFQIEVELKQCMLVAPDPFLDKCLIRKPLKPNHSVLPDLESVPLEDENIQFNIINKEEEKDQQNDLGEEPNDLEVNTKTNKELELDLQLDDINDVFETNKSVAEKPSSILGKVQQNILETEELKEIDIVGDLEESIQIKNHKEVYYEIYQKARQKAKEAKKIAVNTYLEMKNIKKTYMLEDLIDSDSDLENTWR